MNQPNDMYQNEPAFSPFDEGAVFVTMEQYVAKTFLWMFLGLLATFGVAFGLALNFEASPAESLVYKMFSVPYMPIILLVAELGVVIWLSARLSQMAAGTATALFFAYAVLNGIVFSSYFIVYDLSSMVFCFAAAAVYFGVMAAYGYLTKKDLSGWGRMLFAGLIAMLIISLLGLFIGFGMFEIVVCGLGILLFLALTAYDTQKIKAYYYQFSGDAEMAHKASIFGALNLYLDFINIFLYIIRLLGRRSNN